MTAPTIMDVIAKQDAYSKSPHYYLVLDRMPEWVYDRAGNSLVAHDGGFYDFLAIEPGSRDAFGGRKFDIKLTDGSTFQCHGQVWSCAKPSDIEATVSVGIATLERLGGCYVFSSASVSRALLSAWLATNVPSNNYYKYDQRNTLAWLDAHARYSGRIVSAPRARKLRRRGVTVWRDAEGRQQWSPYYERRRRQILDSLSNDPGTVRVGGAA